MMLNSPHYECYDMLKLSESRECDKMLSKLGDHFPEKEQIVLSVELIKINKRGKEQNRILLLTNKALYNLKAKELKKCRRRIDLEKIVSITDCAKSDEFALHIPDEYDYRYKSNEHKDRIIAAISRFHEKVKINEIKEESTEKYIVSKNIARLQTREQRLKRYRELIGKDKYDDELLHINNHKITPIQNFNSNKNTKIRPNDFEFLKVIGRGSFGKVMQVKKKDDDQIYAMKILKKKAIIQKNQVDHTNAENIILRSLQHPFLMKLRFAFQTEAKLYFVLDYFRGGELFFHLKQKRKFNEEEAQFIVAETAMALGHLHSLNFIFRDLKPENILLDYSGHICLTDFGLSKDVGIDQNLSYSFVGTPEYLPPEIIMNLGHSKPVDWWALGILLYELCVGIPPFYSENVHEMYRKIQSAPLLFPPKLSKHCMSLIEQLLVRDPSKRLGSKYSFAAIQKHRFFANIDWKKLYKKEVVPPYKPNVKGDIHSVPTCVDPIFLNEAPSDTPAAVPTLPINGNGKKGNDGFVGFSYFNPDQKGALI